VVGLDYDESESTSLLMCTMLSLKRILIRNDGDPFDKTEEGGSDTNASIEFASVGP